MTYITAKPRGGMKHGPSSGCRREALIEVDEVEWSEMFGLAHPESIMHRVVTERVRKQGDRRPAPSSTVKFVDLLVEAVTKKKFSFYDYVNRALNKRNSSRYVVMEDVFEYVSNHVDYILNESDSAKRLRFLRYVALRLHVADGPPQLPRTDFEQLIILATRAGFIETEIADAWGIPSQRVRLMREGWMR